MIRVNGEPLVMDRGNGTHGLNYGLLHAGRGARGEGGVGASRGGHGGRRRALEPGRLVALVDEVGVVSVSEAAQCLGVRRRTVMGVARPLVAGGRMEAWLARGRRGSRCVVLGGVSMRPCGALSPW